MLFLKKMTDFQLDYRVYLIVFIFSLINMRFTMFDSWLNRPPAGPSCRAGCIITQIKLMPATKRKSIEDISLRIILYYYCRILTKVDSCKPKNSTGREYFTLMLHENSKRKRSEIKLSVWRLVNFILLGNLFYLEITFYGDKKEHFKIIFVSQPVSLMYKLISN